MIHNGQPDINKLADPNRDSMPSPERLAVKLAKMAPSGLSNPHLKSKFD